MKILWLFLVLVKIGSFWANRPELEFELGFPGCVVE